MSYVFPTEYPSHDNKKPARFCYYQYHLNCDEVSQRYKDIIEEVITRHNDEEMARHEFMVDAFMFFVQREFFKKKRISLKNRPYRP
jgi:hypothetical protein